MYRTVGLATNLFTVRDTEREMNVECMC